MWILKGMLRAVPLARVLFVPLAHVTNSRVVGKDSSRIKDGDGKPLTREMLEIARKKGSGWGEDKWVNPLSGNPGTKRHMSNAWAICLSRAACTRNSSAYRLATTKRGV
jgi:hypothetical protein